MFVIVAGGGRTGSHLAYLLNEQKHKVRLIENRPEILAGLHRELPTEVVFEGEGTDPEVLEAAGIRQAQVFAAVNNDDADNLLASTLAKHLFNVRRVIARVNNPWHAWLFQPEMGLGVDVVLDHADIMAKLIEEEMSLGDMFTLSKLRRGKYSLVEEKIGLGAPVIGQMIKDITFPKNCVISGILRKSEMVLPRGVTTLNEGDEIIAMVDDAARHELARLLSGTPQP